MWLPQAASANRGPFNQEKKMKMRTRTKPPLIGDSYFALVQKFPLVPIGDDEHLA